MSKKVESAHICAYIALMLVIVLMILWACNVGGFTVVSLDSFVGVIVALLAILITFVVGWQIHNTMELKEKIKKIKSLEEYINNSHKLSVQISHNNQVGISLNSAILWETKNEYDAAFAMYHNAFHNAIKANTPDLNFYIITFERLLPLFEYIGKSQLEMISRDSASIKETDAYERYFREKYDEIISAVMHKSVRK